MTKRELLLAEKKKTQRQVNLFERKYKNKNTIHHQQLIQINKALAKTKAKPKKKKTDLEKGVSDG